MPLNPPRTLQTLMTGDSATSRVISNVKTAVDPLLQLCNSTFQVANDSSLSFLRRIRSFSADAINATTGKFTTVATNTMAAATTSAGSLIATSASVLGNLTATGTLTGSSVVSSSGFKGFGPVFSYNGSIAAGAYINMGVAGVAANMPQKYPYAGSVVGSSITFYCSATTSTLQFFITGATGDILATYGPNNYTGVIYFSSTYPKGSKPFAANGDLICKVYSPTAISSIQVQIVPLLEFGA